MLLGYCYIHRVILFIIQTFGLVFAFVAKTWPAAAMSMYPGHISTIKKTQ